MKKLFASHKPVEIGKNCEIGRGTTIWQYSQIHQNSVIGRNCTLGQNVTLGPNGILGNNCKIQNNVSIYEGVIIKDDVFCGPSCVFTNVLTPRANIDRKHQFKHTIVNKGVSIGANATIICGIELGEYCMIAAGAVVTKSVPNFALTAGVPARQIGWVSRYGDVLAEDLICPSKGDFYELKNGNLFLRSSNG